MSQFTKNRNFDPAVKPQRWLMWSGAFITIFLFTNINDPFNAPKSWALSISGSWLLGWVVFQFKSQIKDSIQKWSSYISLFFILSLTTAFIATDNKYIGFFGEYQRKTGYLTYFSLIIFFIASSYLIRLNRIGALFQVSLFVGLLTGIYGFIQHFGLDPIKWNNPYNSVLGTLGNPDFAAAAMAIFAILNFGILIQSKLKLYWRLLAGFNVLLLFLVIKYSQVRQGFLVGFLGIDIIVMVWIYQKHRILSFLLAGATLITGVFGIAGMLKIGPLTNFFYKASVTYRGDYWRAGWRMFISHPLFGVGLDRYGENFRTYRDNTQSMRRGPDLVSNAAHNIPIQLASTGGIFLLVAYLILVGFVLWRSFIALRNSSGANQIIVATVFAAWVAYQAQSIISIDNIGIAIWGYILGGALIGLSTISTEVKKPQQASILQAVVSPLFASILFVVSALFLQSESAMRIAKFMPIPSQGGDLAAYMQTAEKPLKYVFKEPNFQFIYANNLARAGQLERAIEISKELIKNDPKFYEAHMLLASIYEFKSDWQNAINVRTKILEIDPYNPNNEGQLKSDQAKLLK